MRYTHFWHQLYLYSKKITCLTILFTGILSTALFAQKPKKPVKLNLVTFDERKLHYGFQLGLFNSNMRLSRSDDYSGVSTPQGKLAYIEPLSTTGFTIGFILNMALPHKHFDFRVNPAVSFYERAISYTSRNQGGFQDTLKTQETTVIEIPLLLKYKSARRYNHRVYMVGGVIGGFQVSNKQEGDPDEYISLDKVNIELAFGLGMNLYMEMFNFAPEIRFSHSLNSIFSSNNSADNIYARPIDGLVPYRISFILNFEG